VRRRFFVEEFEGDCATLRGETAHHLGRVLRAEAGQLYELSDGESVWLGRAERVTGEEVRFTLVEQLPVRRSPIRITLLLAIVKFDRFEWAIEKATELGVDEIVPLAAERSEQGLITAAVKRAARWQKILIESAQQSRRLSVPVLHGAIVSRKGFEEANGQVRLLLSEQPHAKPMRDLVEPAVASLREDVRLDLAIGPEGGWTEKEFSAGHAAGFTEAALGTNILRTETAVCAALAAMQYAFGATARAGEGELQKHE
jgi:16S rRNA (uracil1498-N3)-methyltransferase